MMISDALDSKSLYEDVFKVFYDWGKQISFQGLPAVDGEPQLKPFNITHNSDMKAAWYLSNRGGGGKSTNFFCMLCSYTRVTLLAYNVEESHCNHCKKRGKSKCYHHSICDSVTVEALMHELESELGDYYKNYGKQYYDIRKKTKIKTDT
jgi:hypothetical protein